MPYWVKVTRTGDTFAGQISPDGTTWETIGEIDIVMSANATIGIAITSHVDGDTLAVAEVSEITFAGNVSDGWKIEDIGVDQPS